ncbi:hypothetical protein HK102_002362 [Quaeritorhiza haematococci]|nr:hypothetical protein HK102_002362 [Quaeritorhiza haematococci]
MLANNNNNNNNPPNPANNWGKPVPPNGSANAWNPTPPPSPGHNNWRSSAGPSGPGSGPNPHPYSGWNTSNNGPNGPPPPPSHVQGWSSAGPQYQQHQQQQRPDDALWNSAAGYASSSSSSPRRGRSHSDSWGNNVNGNGFDTWDSVPGVSTNAGWGNGGVPPPPPPTQPGSSSWAPPRMQPQQDVGGWGMPPQHTQFHHHQQQQQGRNHPGNPGWKPTAGWDPLPPSVPQQQFDGSSRSVGSAPLRWEGKQNRKNHQQQGDDRSVSFDTSSNSNNTKSQRGGGGGRKPSGSKSGGNNHHNHQNGADDGQNGSLRKAKSTPNFTRKKSGSNNNKDDNKPSVKPSSRLFTRQFDEVNRSLGLNSNNKELNNEDNKPRRRKSTRQQQSKGNNNNTDISKAVGLYIFGFPKWVRVGELIGIFSQYGAIVNVGIVNKPKRHERTYAYVDYESAGCAQKAIEALKEKTFFEMSQPLELSPHFEKTERASSSSASAAAAASSNNTNSQNKGAAGQSTTNKKEVGAANGSTDGTKKENADKKEEEVKLDYKTIHIGNLPQSVDKAELEKLFSVYGDLKRIHTVQRPKEKRAFAFVSYRDPESAKKALNAIRGPPDAPSQPVFFNMSEPLKAEYSRAEQKEKKRRPVDEPWKKGEALKKLERSVKDKTSKASSSSSSGKDGRSGSGKTKTVVYVQQIPADMIDAEVVAKFEEFGTIKSYHIVQRVTPAVIIIPAPATATTPSESKDESAQQQTEGSSASEITTPAVTDAASSEPAAEGTGTSTTGTPAAATQDPTVIPPNAIIPPPCRYALIVFEKPEDAGKAAASKLLNATFPRQRRLHLANLPHTATEADLRGWFADAGEVRKVEIIHGADSTNSQEAATSSTTTPTPTSTAEASQAPSTTDAPTPNSNNTDSTTPQQQEQLRTPLEATVEFVRADGAVKALLRALSVPLPFTAQKMHAEYAQSIRREGEKPEKTKETEQEGEGEGEGEEIADVDAGNDADESSDDDEEAGAEAQSTVTDTVALGQDEVKGKGDETVEKEEPAAETSPPAEDTKTKTAEALPAAAPAAETVVAAPAAN